MPIPFSPKLRLAPLWPAAAALALAAGLAVLLLPPVLAEAAAEDLRSTLRLLARTAPLPSGNLGRPDPALQEQLHERARGTGLRVTLIALDGTVLADTDRTFEQVLRMDNHLARPEIAAALARGEGHAVRHSDTTGRDTAYAAALLADAGGPVAIVRLGRPIATLAALERHLAGVLVASATAAGLLVVVLSWWLTRRLFRPLASLIDAAHRMGEGNDSIHVDVPESGELATLARALERIAARARTQIAAVEAERDHLRATVASMTEGVLVTDRKGQPQLVNPAMRELFALPADTPARRFLELARQPRFDDLVRGTLALHSGGSTEIEILEPVARSLVLLSTPLGSDEGVVVVARDVTAAERLSRMRKDFVANVSHELKTPLSAIRGYAETLVDGALDDRATALRFSERILDQCRRLGALLDDLLTLSRLEGAEPFRDIERVDLREVAGQAAELVAAAAGERKVAVGLVPGGPVTVDGDADGLLRLAANLLDNAVKYNRPGGRVDVRIERRGDSAVLEVADDGIGIASVHLSRLFERFYRVDKGRSRDEGGTGLGLAIVKHVAQAHGGRVEVDSEPGRGSTFRVVLPAAPAVAPA